MTTKRKEIQSPSTRHLCVVVPCVSHMYVSADDLAFLTVSNLIGVDPELQKREVTIVGVRGGYHLCNALETLFISLDSSNTYTTTETALLLVLTQYLVPSYALFMCGVERK